MPPRFGAIALLLIFGWLQLSSLDVTSATMDEPSHLASGYAFLTRGDTRIRLNGPILPNLIGAVPLLLQPGLQLTPPDDPMWAANDHNGISDLFVWHNTVSPFRIIYLARFPFMAISWALGALIFRWAHERYGSGAGLFALTLYVFCPNLLAHSRLVMTDFVPTASAFLAMYFFDRSLRQSENRKGLMVAGIGLGLALASKFSLVMLMLAVAILTAINLLTTEAWQHRERARVFQVAAATGRLSLLLTVAVITVWSVYTFRIGPVSTEGVSVPAPGFWREWESAQYYLNQPWPNYLRGETSTAGWWYYFPIAFVLKTPLPILILLIIALGRTIIRRTGRGDLVLLLPSFLIFFGLLFSTNNLGYRYLLPILPLLFVYVSGLVSGPPWQSHECRQSSVPQHSGLSPLHLIPLSLLVWQVVGTLNIYPYYLTFFNEIAGGPDRGRYILSDSNVDWGQDLVGLKSYVDQHRIDRVKLSYFGVAHPTAYNLTTEALPPVRTAMNDQGGWWLHTYYPVDPAPGVYAISVANLMGGIWIDPGAYAYFRDRRPDTTIGNSIYIYTIPPRGTPVNLSLSGLQIDEIDPETYKILGTNDVRPRWFDATSSAIAAPDSSWIAIADNTPIAPELTPLFASIKPIAQAKTTDDQRPYALYHFDLGRRILNAAQQSDRVAPESKLPVKFGDTTELIGYSLARVSDPSPGMTLITFWRADDQAVAPLQLFVHALGPDGSIVAQEDRLDAPAYGWRPSDIIVQINHLTIPAGSDQMRIEVGLYQPDTGGRLPVLIDGRRVDRGLLLKQINLK